MDRAQEIQPRLISEVLKQVEDGRARSRRSQELGVIETTSNRWRRKFGGFEILDAPREGDRKKREIEWVSSSRLSIS